MLTERENYLQTVRYGKPDRIVVQWGPLVPIMNDPCMKFLRGNRVKGTNTIDKWGTHVHWPMDQVAAMPHVTEETKVIKDITRWREYTKAPDLVANATDWTDALELIKTVDRKENMTMSFMGTGMFEQMHYLMGFEDTLMNMLEEPEATEDLLEHIFQFRCTYAKLLVDNLHPDAVLSHDDWGSKTRLFMSPAIWRKLFKERYRQFYKIFKDAGTLVIHHADCYCEDIVEDMAEIGIDVWQGAVCQNNIPKMQKLVHGRMGFMGGLDSAIVDRAAATEEEIRAEVRRACDEYIPGGGFIPNLPSGLKNSALFPGVDATIDDEIRKYSKKFFPY